MGYNLRLHPDTIEEIKQRADIVDIIGERVVLRKRGKDYVGLCPFHEEKSPSFTVSPHKQMYYCFGCQSGGNGIKFLMDLEKRSFSDVLLDLARRYQIVVKSLAPEQQAEFQRQANFREQLYEILAIAASFYQHVLAQPGNSALAYLQTNRQLSQETIQYFQLGLAPSGWETVYGYLVKQKGFPPELVEKTGLIKPRKSGDSYYDIFRNRLMIPIHDPQGRIIGFGGRSLGDEQPKYLNSPDTELFHKSQILFAIDKAKTAIAKSDQAIIVEGYFDAIALHSRGINQVVAALGTALHIEQIRQLLRYTESKQIVFNFDADRAGNNAVFRAVEGIYSLVYAGEIQLRIINLPTGKDADEFLKTSDPTAYKELLQNAPLWLDWQIEQLLTDQDLKQADQYQQVFQGMVKLLNQITNENQRTHYLSRCAEILSQGKSRMVLRLIAQLKKQLEPQLVGKLKRDRTPALSVGSDSILLEKAEALLLRLYLHCSEQRQRIINLLEEKDLQFSLSHHRFLWQQLLKLRPISETEQPDLISKLQDLLIEFPTQMKQVFHLFHLDEYTERDLIRASELIQDAATQMERIMYDKHRSQILELWKKTDISKDRELAEKYHQELSAIEQKIVELDRQINSFR